MHLRTPLPGGVRIRAPKPAAFKGLCCLLHRALDAGNPWSLLASYTLGNLLEHSAVRSPPSGSWAANHVRLVIVIVFASLAGPILLGLAVCCCARCRRRAREGRLGRRLPAWLLPTPSPQRQRRPRSPLDLRTKYCGACSLLGD